MIVWCNWVRVTLQSLSKTELQLMYCKATACVVCKQHLASAFVHQFYHCCCALASLLNFSAVPLFWNTQVIRCRLRSDIMKRTCIHGAQGANSETESYQSVMQALWMLSCCRNGEAPDPNILQWTSTQRSAAVGSCLCNLMPISIRCVHWATSRIRGSQYNLQQH